MKKALMIFVKAPIKGTVKTRLQVDLGADKTLHTYKAFVTEITSRCGRLKNMDKFLGCTPDKKDPFLQEVAGKNNMKMFNQRGDTLGKKIVNAFREHFRKGYAEVVLIGSDSPTIPGAYIRKAFAALRENDYVIGPCCDGGMYLIGAKNRMDAQILKDIPWDTSEVLNLVLENIYRQNARLHLLPFWYDVDNIDDLRFLKLHLKYLQKDIPF